MEVYVSLAQSCEMALKLQHSSAQTHCERFENQVMNLFDAEVAVKEMLEKHGDACHKGPYLSQFQHLNERAHLSLRTINQLYVAYHLDHAP